MTYSESEREFTFAKNRPMYHGVIQKITLTQFLLRHGVHRVSTRNSSGDEIANVNFLYDDIVHALKIQ